MTRTESVSSTAVAPELVALLQSCSNDLTDDTAKLVTADWCAENGYESLEWLLRWLVEHPRQLLFTGSRCYGTPKPDSDFDWVLKIANRDMFEGLEIEQWADTSSASLSGYKQYGSAGIDEALRFGPVNVIVVSLHTQWASWCNGTAQLEAEAPVTRERAVEVFQTQFRRRRLNRQLVY